MPRPSGTAWPRSSALHRSAIEVIRPYAGGGFGQKNSLQMQTVLAAVAARRLGRPVKIVVPRAQIFHDASFRPASRHRVRLGADARRPHGGGHPRGGCADLASRSVPGEYASTSARAATDSSNFRGRERLVRTDVQTPGYMRAPFEHAACFALESAWTNWRTRSVRIPVALRLANDTATDPITEAAVLVAPCWRNACGAAPSGSAGQAHAWRRSRCVPNDGTLIGWGVAAGAYPGIDRAGDRAAAGHR